MSDDNSQTSEWVILQRSLSALSIAGRLIHMLSHDNWQLSAHELRMARLGRDARVGKALYAPLADAGLNQQNRVLKQSTLCHGCLDCPWKNLL